MITSFGARGTTRGSLVARDLVKSYGSSVILNGVSVTVSPAERLAIVGPNGIGKSTLLRILAGLEAPDRGTVEQTNAAMTVGYLPQEPDADPAETLRAYLARRTGVGEAEREMDELADAMGGDLGLIEAYTESVDRFIALGGRDFDARAAEQIAALGLPRGSLEQPVGTLSGGQAARAALAAILLARFDVFLLDEPTNNLDFKGLALLEDFLEVLDAGLVVVSHDRAFLEATARRVLEIDEGTRTASDYSGGFDAYLAARATARAAQYDAHERYVAERGRLTEQIRKRKSWAAAGASRAKRFPDDPDKSIRAGRIEGAEDSAAKAKALERRLERLERVDKPWESWRLELSFDPARRSGDIVFTLEDAIVRRGSFQLGPVDLDVRWGDRVAIVGPNGSGKSTLVDALLGHVPLSAGRRRTGRGVEVGMMDQPRETFASDRPFLEVFTHRSHVLPEEARSLLAKFSLAASHVDRPASSLSPGERSRALLALLAARRANCLVLDEPTNHLDLAAIEQLERALAGYPGTVLLVSHDRRLLDAFHATATVGLSDGVLQ